MLSCIALSIHLLIMIVEVAMKMPRFVFSILIAGFGLVALSSGGHSQEAGLANCAAQFPGGTVEGAPTNVGVDPSMTIPGNVHLCNRLGDTSFFALEYNPKRVMADWVAYKLSDTFGPNKCASFPRDDMQCFFKFAGQEYEHCLRVAGTDDDNARDPFHADDYLEEKEVAFLRTGSFSRTGHDRGHLAPNNAFSWNLCGTYKTFSMANMAAQIWWFNRNIWRLLEENVLYWGVEHGPVYVATGPIYNEFPYDKFEIIKNGRVKKSEIVKPGTILKRSDGTNASPELTDPTGFFKVIYKLASGDQSARAVAFLLPHTPQKYKGYLSFVSTVALVEEMSGLKFGFPEELKRGRDNHFFLERRTPRGWSVRGRCDTGYRPQNLDLNLSVSEREKLCAGVLGHSGN